MTNKKKGYQLIEVWQGNKLVRSGRMLKERFNSLEGRREFYQIVYELPKDDITKKVKR